MLGEKVLAVTASSPIHPERETQAALSFAKERHVPHLVLQSKEMALPEFASNGPDRCYHCKRSLFQGLFEIAGEKGLKNVAHGANIDDLSDYRPGFMAAAEAGAVAPLMDVGLNKEEIRFLSSQMGLPTWDKPPMACLATRIPFGEPITERKLRMVEKAEAFLFERGLSAVRVRHHGPVARIELGAGEEEKLLDRQLRGEVVNTFLEIGFEHVALDLEGYVPGKLNRSIEHKS